MNEARWPTLSIHDFLGYFVPGALALYLVLSVLRGQAAGHISIPNFTWETGLLFFLAAYVSGYFLSFLSAMFLETYAIEAYGYPSQYLFRYPHPRPRIRVPQLIVRMVILPVFVLDWFLGSKLGLSKRFTKPCDEVVGQVIKRKIRHLIGTKDLKQVEFFHLVGHWVREYAAGHAAILQIHVARKGFLRTLAFLAVLATWVGWLMLAISGDSTYLMLVLTSTPLSYVAFLTYLKQERRFTLETLMAFAVRYDEEVA